MPDYSMIDVKETPYLYAERTCSMDPADISKHMGEAFVAVTGFMLAHEIKSMGNAISVYYDYHPDRMTFRAGFVVSAGDASKADGDIRTDVLPAGRVLNFMHLGPYSKLRDSYAEMMTYLQDQNLSVGSPSWEVYLNEPSEVASEDDLKTDVYVTLG